MEKPNIFLHMTNWGFFSGTILALLYFAAVSNDIAQAIAILFNPGAWILAAQFGGIPGIFLGLVDAIFLWFLVRRLPRPFTPEAMKSNRLKVYSLAFIFTLIGGLFLTSWVWIPGSQYGLDIALILLFALVPSLIAASAATYASHRYLFALRRYDEQDSQEKFKGKPKQDMSRLADSVHVEEHRLEELDNDSLRNENY